MNTVEALPAYMPALDAALSPIESPARRRELISAVIASVDALNKGEAGVLLLAARRMTCLYSLLREAGLPAPDRGTVISDRFLELLPDGAWSGQRVILLDDTTVTGKTLDEREAAAVRLVASKSDVTRKPAITIPKLDPEGESFELHRQFASAFANRLVPFFTDFPVSDEVAMTAGAFDRLVSSRSWRAVEVTNAVAAGSGARAYSLFPGDELMADFEAVLGDLRRLVEIVKIRVYAYDSGSTVLVRVVPIVLTHAVREESVRRWLDDINVVASESTEQTAKALGVATFMLSRELLHVFNKYARSFADRAFDEQVDFAELSLGDALNKTATSHYLPSLALLQVEDGRDPQPAPAVFAWPNAEELLSHFVVIGDDAVLPGFEALRQTQLKIGGRRSKGWEKDATTLRGIADASQSNVMTASLAIDVLNDLGYAVPAQLHDDGVLFRGYRAGEAALREIEAFRPGVLGGKLAAYPVTAQISDADYFEEARTESTSR